MNPTIESIMTRRSVRAYLPGAVPEEDMRVIAEAGAFAPSAMNTQPWRLIVLPTRDKLDIIMKAFRALAFARADVKMMENEDIFYGAESAVLVCADKSFGNADGDCGGVCANLCVAAKSLGYGSCVVGQAANALNSEVGGDAKSALGVPDGFRVYAAVIVGKTNENPEPKPRRENAVVWAK